MFHVKHKNVGRVIAIANQKGGVGKTTTTINLAASLAVLNQRVLIIDIDPQGNTSSGLGLDKNQLRHDTYALLEGRAGLDQSITNSAYDRLFIVPTNMDLAGAEIEMVNTSKREFRLNKALKQYQGEPFDVVLIDCPPALSLLTLNAMVAADELLVPLQAEFYALEGLSQLIETVRRIRASMNPELALGGIVLTMVDKRNNLSQQVEAEARDYFGKQVYQQVIPRNVRLSEAPSYGVPTLYHDARSIGAQAYLNMAQEFIQRH